MEEIKNTLIQASFDKLKKDKEIISGKKYYRADLYAGIIIGLVASFFMFFKNTGFSIFLYLTFIIFSILIKKTHERIDKVVEILQLDKKLEKDCQLSAAEIAKLNTNKNT